MRQAEFETFVNNHKQLSMLINTHSFNALTSIKKTDEMTPEFVEWISPKYYEAFLAIFERHYDTKQGLICGVIRASFLANQQTIDRMALVVQSHLELAISKTKEFQNFIIINPYDCEKVLPMLDIPFGYLTKAIFEYIPSDLLKPIKSRYTTLILENIAILYEFSPNEKKLPYGLIERFHSEIRELTLNKEEKEFSKKELQKADQKAIKLFLIITLVIAILFVLYLIFKP